MAEKSLARSELEYYMRAILLLVVVVVVVVTIFDSNATPFHATP